MQKCLKEWLNEPLITAITGAWIIGGLYLIIVVFSPETGTKILPFYLFAVIFLPFLLGLIHKHFKDKKV